MIQVIRQRIAGELARKHIESVMEKQQEKTIDLRKCDVTPVHPYAEDLLDDFGIIFPGSP